MTMHVVETILKRGTASFDRSGRPANSPVACWWKTSSLIHTLQRARCAPSKVKIVIILIQSKGVSQVGKLDLPDGSAWPSRATVTGRPHSC